jgi:hypothetical protein
MYKKTFIFDPFSDPYPLMCQVSSEQKYLPDMKLPIHHLTLTVTLQVSSTEHLQNCSRYYSQKVYDWLTQQAIKNTLIKSCEYLTPNEIQVQDAGVRIDNDSKKVSLEAYDSHKSQIFIIFLSVLYSYKCPWGVHGQSNLLTSNHFFANG